MAISLASLRRSGQLEPMRALIYGSHGLGKTSLAAGAPAPIFVQTEDGLGLIEADTFGIIKTYDEIMQAIGELYTQPHDFQTVVVDSADWLEPIIAAETCRLNGWSNLESAGYGKGPIAALETWRVVLEGLSALRNERGMTVLILAHAEAKRFDSPDVQAYDRYRPKLHEKASALVQEHVDCCFFLNYAVSITRDNPKDKNSRVRGVGGGNRMLYTAERPAYIAKNRYRMPHQIPLPDDPAEMWSAVAQHIPYYSTTAKEAA